MIAFAVKQHSNCRKQGIVKATSGGILNLVKLQLAIIDFQFALIHLITVLFSMPYMSLAILRSPT